MPGAASGTYVRDEVSPTLSPGGDSRTEGTGGPLITVEPSQGARDPQLDRILRSHQVPGEKPLLGADGQPLRWRPAVDDTIADRVIDGGAGLLGWLGEQTGLDPNRSLEKTNAGTSFEALPTERKLLEELSTADQMTWALTSRYAKNRSGELVPPPAGNTMSKGKFANDGHQDAVRHALWNAVMTKEFGADGTEAYGTAHEMSLINPAAREAMDLHNNRVGRQIALAHPDATREEIEGHVLEALRNGELLVIDKNGQLAWSNQVAVGEHGFAKEGVFLPADQTFTDDALKRD